MPSGYCKERGRTGGLRSITLTLPSYRHPSHVKQVKHHQWGSNLGRPCLVIYITYTIIITITVSLGPGVPSGHSQAAAVILWCLTDVLRSARPSLSLGLWTVFTAGQVLMWTSRLYISAHFPHQCLMGFIVGLLAVRYMVQLMLPVCLIITFLAQDILPARLLGAVALAPPDTGCTGAGDLLPGALLGAGEPGQGPSLVT